MAADKYRHAEDEYFKLRGQFDTGRLTQEQFDEKLRALMIQDEQGRYWMLGADSGKWYFYDGAKWVQGEPYAGATVPPPAVMPGETRPASSPPPVVSATPVEDKRRFPWALLLILFALIALGIAAFLVYQNRERIFVAPPPPTVVVVLPPTITRAPSPTAAALVPTTAPATLEPLPTVIIATPEPPTLAPTQPIATNVPAITVVVVTEVPPPTIELPTLLPSATTPPTAQPTATRAIAPATATKIPPTKTAVPTCPNGVCVTDLKFSPAAPKRNQDVTFTATFLNSTNETKFYNWLILVYRQGQTKGFGESAAFNISIPPGVSTFNITHTVVKGPGGCEPFYARAGWKVSAFEKYDFPNISGDPATANFDVCP